MGRCYDNPKYDKPNSDIQNTWEHTYSIEKPKQETLEVERFYTEQEVRDLLEMQRGNCYVALLSHTKNEDIATVALGAPEPGGRNGTWVK